MSCSDVEMSPDSDVNSSLKILPNLRDMPDLPDDNDSDLPLRPRRPRKRNLQVKARSLDEERSDSKEKEIVGDKNDEPEFLRNTTNEDDSQKNSVTVKPSYVEFIIPERGRFKCTICSNTFSQRRIANEHYRRIHNNERRFKCFCGKSYFSSSDFKLHKMSKHGQDDVSNLQCGKCGKLLSTPTRRLGHELSVCKLNYSEEELQAKGVTVTTCPFKKCNRKFAIRSELKMHIRQHRGETVEPRGDYRCPICDHRFTTRSGLTKHKRRKHSTKKPQTCPNCSEKFPTKEELGQHFRAAHKGTSEPEQEHGEVTDQPQNVIALPLGIEEDDTELDQGPLTS